jgi:hypothetical protein
MQAGLFEGGISIPESLSGPRHPLTDTERARTAELRRLHLELLPEFEPFVKSLHKLGMIDGWRALTYVEVGPPRECPGAYCGPFLHGDEHYKAYPKGK